MSTQTLPQTGRRAATPAQAAVRAGKPLPVRAAKLLARSVMVGIMVVAVAAFLFLAIGPRVFGYQTSTMLTGSMSPLINPGDVVVSVPTAVANLNTGDIITYHIPVEDQRIETHRITDVTRSGGPPPSRPRATRTTAPTRGPQPWPKTTRSPPWPSSRTSATRSAPSAPPWLAQVLLYGAPTLLVIMLLASIWSKPQEPVTEATATAAPVALTP